jgi:hypothetical protein
MPPGVIPERTDCVSTAPFATFPNRKGEYTLLPSSSFSFTAPPIVLSAATIAVPPATKGRIAKETWNKFSETEKRAKVLDIKSRASQDFVSVETQLQPQFQTWSKENEGDFIDFLISLPGDKLPMNFYGKYGANFFLTNKSTLKNYYH